LLSPALNEVHLYHGSSAEVVDIIVHHGFDERVAQMSGLYGAGVYFANQSCKASQYVTADQKGVKTLIIARVSIGDPHYAASGLQNQRRPPERGSPFSKGTLFDSVVANGGTGSQVHREIIVYDHRQAYPEYVVRWVD
jgi:hypothetical protein